MEGNWHDGESSTEREKKCFLNLKLYNYVILPSFVMAQVEKDGDIQRVYDTHTNKHTRTHT